MDTRRDFIKKAALLAGGQGFVGTLPPAVLRALSIDPAKDSTWTDAEHIVILMQENRSFDHCYGALRGVRGFRDPRAFTLPNGNPVWLQTNDNNETYAPFRLDIKGTMATWMGSLPHDWTNQSDARNEGRFDKWLQAKPSGHKDYAHMPLTLGHYIREDVPFYYALADAFTICDQAFCSTLTGTTPNRLHLWTGTIRDEPNTKVRPRVRNEDTDYGVWADYTTFPERLEDNGISWKIYQNEIGLDITLDPEANAWLSNFQDNPIEWFKQYHVKYSSFYTDALPKKIAELETAIARMKAAPGTAAPDNANAEQQKKIAAAEKMLAQCKEDLQQFTKANFDKLPERERNLHAKAFDTNRSDPDYHQLSTVSYQDGTTTREMQVPKGDVLHSFREDVKSGKLPTVSWLVPPERYSDHPSSAWYGPWYISEALDILTENPEVWRKTIFILCYDENDGYFDHVPPFVAPHPDKPGTGLASKGIDTALEHMTREQDLERTTEDHARGGPLGLGFRVPLVIASPWSRGGFVNSQVFDHTSILMFLEKFLTGKTGKKIEETNINSWRRTVCGDLTSVFRPFRENNEPVPFPGKQEFLAGIHQAKFKPLPADFVALTAPQIELLNREPSAGSWTKVQESGTRPACALPYELYADAEMIPDKSGLVLSMGAATRTFRDKAAGSPFTVYSYGRQFKTRNYAVRAGNVLADTFPMEDFADGRYNLKLVGPNGFFRSFAGSKDDPLLQINLSYDFDPNGKLTGAVKLDLVNDMAREYTVHIRDNAYGAPDLQIKLDKGGTANSHAMHIIDPSKHGGWYDFSVTVEGAGSDHRDDREQRSSFEWRYAGHVETGRDSISDPAMG